MRPMNSLLEEHLDFSLANKLPPTITKETTYTIENAIKQRILDELFDDPVRIYVQNSKRNINDDDAFDFIKSKKGLGDLYEDDLRNKLIQQDPNAYLHHDISGGADSGVKKEIDSLMKNLFYQLDCLSNFNYTPKPSSKEV